MRNYLAHHGILGQKWGTRNGPPYPLKGGSYSRKEERAILKERESNKYSRYNKQHYDDVLEKGTTISTLSYDPNRTKNVDMFFASHTRHDMDHYNEFFNKKAPRDIYDSSGNNIGTGQFYKYQIKNKAKTDLKVASEDSGAQAFMDLYESDRDFYNFVTDPNRLSDHFEKGVHKLSFAYNSARDSLKKMQNPDYIPTEDDVYNVYKIFNHAIPSDGFGDNRANKDIATQRAKFFNLLQKRGYGAVLDTNDALYNTVGAESPIIVFDMKSIIPDEVYQTKMSDVYMSKAKVWGRRLLGIDF